MNIEQIKSLINKIRNSSEFTEVEKKFIISSITKDLTILEQRQLNSISVSSGSCNCCGKPL